MVIVTSHGEHFLAANFIDAALMSGGQYHRKSYRVWTQDQAATVAADTADKAHAAFNSAFKRDGKGAVIQAITG